MTSPPTPAGSTSEPTTKLPNSRWNPSAAGGGAAGGSSYPDATRLLITADAGGCNDPRRWTWKKHLHAFAIDSGLEIMVCHYPPGTSKWNKIEHRMFCHITANWRGRPLTSYQVVIETIAATTTSTGLTIGADLDTSSYPLGGTGTSAEFHALPITPDAFRGDWNYSVAPCAPRPAEQAPTHRRLDPAVTDMLTDPALTGMSRADFAHLAAVSEPYWDALAEAAFQRRFHRPRGYLHPQTSSVDHFHRLLTALLRRRRAATSTLLAQLLGITRTNLSNQFRDGHRILDLHRIDVSPMPGSPARTLEQLQARLTIATQPKINSNSNLRTSPGPDRELPGRGVPHGCHLHWARVPGSGVVSAAVVGR